ncbi:MAG: hypothetical protein Q4D42_09305, partial [Eubacteriales bacterium]|nr:hypothetical protein [Eubacteriales bacterium]
VLLFYTAMKVYTIHGILPRKEIPTGFGEAICASGKICCPCIPVHPDAGGIFNVFGDHSVFALFWILLSMAVPNVYTNIFMTPTQKILDIALSIEVSVGCGVVIYAIQVFVMIPPLHFYTLCPIVPSR